MRQANVSTLPSANPLLPILEKFRILAAHHSELAEEYSYTPGARDKMQYCFGIADAYQAVVHQIEKELSSQMYQCSLAG